MKRTKVNPLIIGIAPMSVVVARAFLSMATSRAVVVVIVVIVVVVALVLISMVTAAVVITVVVVVRHRFVR